MDVYKWQEIPTEQISPTQSRKVIHTERATVVRLVTEKDTAIPLHNHVHEQVTMVVSGSFQFDMQGETATLGPGEILRIPSDVPHQARALEDSVTIELFVPARDDWKHSS